MASIRSTRVLTVCVSSVFCLSRVSTRSVSDGVLPQHLDQHAGLLPHLLLALLADQVQLFAMLRVGEARHLVAVGLTGLRQQDQRRGIGGLGREGEIEQNEGIDVELGPARGVDPDPQRDDEGLRDKEGRRAEEAREILRFLPEPVISKGRFEMGMRQVNPAHALVTRRFMFDVHASSVARQATGARPPATRGPTIQKSERISTPRRRGERRPSGFGTLGRRLAPPRVKRYRRIIPHDRESISLIELNESVLRRRGFIQRVGFGGLSNSRFNIQNQGRNHVS